MIHLTDNNVCGDSANESGESSITVSWDMPHVTDYEEINLSCVYEIKSILPQCKIYNTPHNVYCGLRNCKGELLRFVTITLSPKLYKFKALTQYDISIPEVLELMQHFTKFYVGCIELTADCNVHYHAIVYFNEKLQQLKFLDILKRKHKIFGFVKVTKDTIKTDVQLKRSIDYIYKDVENTAKFIKRNHCVHEIVFGNI